MHTYESLAFTREGWRPLVIRRS